MDTNGTENGGNGSIPSSKTPGSALNWDDATWILTSSFIIFTMQSGFGLLEAGTVSIKNEVNIMVKNAVDVIFGGISYWLFGFGVTFGSEERSNPFSGYGYFLLDPNPEVEGQVMAMYVFQLSFSTTATTIVSGAMAERTKLSSYIIFSFFNTIVYVFPAHWVWGSNGFLRSLGCVDIAGSGVVHTLGGFSAFVAAYLLGPRIGRYDADANTPPMGCPANALIGMFMLWWGWLGFNCGSTFGISGRKWILASRSAVTTLNSSMAGGVVGLLSSAIRLRGKYDVGNLVNSVLGGLVAITASCAVCRPWEAFIIGAVGGAVALGGQHLMDKIKVDDPVGAIAVHGFGGMWGMVAVGLFVDIDKFENMTRGQRGLFHGGGLYLLGVQLLAIVCMAAWSSVITFIILFTTKKVFGLRLTAEQEIRGSDLVEHNIQRCEIDKFDSAPLFSRRPSRVSVARRKHSNGSGNKRSVAPIVTMIARQQGDSPLTNGVVSPNCHNQYNGVTSSPRTHSRLPDVTELPHVPVNTTEEQNDINETKEH